MNVSACWFSFVWIPVQNQGGQKVVLLAFDLNEWVDITANDVQIVKVTGIKNMGRTTTVVVRGSNALVCLLDLLSCHELLSAAFAIVSLFSVYPFYCANGF
jgi:hypothetical protein